MSSSSAAGQGACQLTLAPAAAFACEAASFACPHEDHFSKGLPYAWHAHKGDGAHVAASSALVLLASGLVVLLCGLVGVLVVLVPHHSPLHLCRSLLRICLSQSRWAPATAQQATCPLCAPRLTLTFAVTPVIAAVGWCTCHGARSVSKALAGPDSAERSGWAWGRTGRLLLHSSQAVVRPVTQIPAVLACPVPAADDEVRKAHCNGAGCQLGTSKPHTELRTFRGLAGSRHRDAHLLSV